MAKRVFISHSTNDKHWADSLCNSLESVGISCWIAPRDIQPGQSWAEAIVSGIAESSILLLLLSESSIDSKNVMREVELADGKNKILVTVKLDDIQPSGALEFFLRLPQSVNCFRTDFDRYITSVIQGIAQHLPDYNMHELNTSVPQLWQHLSTHGLSIIMGRFNTLELKRWERSGLVGYGSVMAISELNTYLGKLGINNYSLTFADQVHEDLLQNNLILLGGDVNQISMRFMSKVETNIIHGYGVTFKDQTNAKSYAPILKRTSKDEQIVTDYGLIIYADNPFAKGRKVLYIAGCFGFGTWGGVQYATSYQFMQHELVQKGIPLECLVEVDVTNETSAKAVSLIMRPLSNVKYK
jgi:hypothetical protein